MNIQKFDIKDFRQLKILLSEYKKSIGESSPNDDEFIKLKSAIKNKLISFYTAREEDRLVAMCSICITYSTFNFARSGIFEDFYVMPEYRKKGIARMLTDFVFLDCKAQKIESLWVGCADTDVNMYKSLGFEIPLGNLLTWSID
ncbi:GNAT family N-acetyltransferase [Sedimentibacter sp. zth1]|uniref:GNAT family N-acetyltransferase n=1 Tax=Sedimentibacter sp. zth1 TaxID=2816908 RepID=UPI001A91E275|nr:GNAT family N-acetyltransferase [Sedimentibacter sp. zth1]QSX05120.1 GNAT family N-acetyltransferase [Sedimentibacter sp. zth1]